MSESYRIHPSCCDAMRKHQAVFLVMPDTFMEDDTETPPHWEIQSYRPYNIPANEWANPQPWEKLFSTMTAAVKCCPFCAEPLPEIVKVDVGDEKVCVITDGGYYCHTCDKRLMECTCLPPMAVWGTAKYEPRIRIVDAEQQYIPENGDVLWGAASDWAGSHLEEGWEQKPEYQERVSGLKLNVLNGTEFKDNQILMMVWVGQNPIRAAKVLGIDIKFFCAHKDPYTGSKVYGIVPTAILTDDTQKYAESLKHIPFQETALDSDFHKEMYGKHTFKSRPGKRGQEINELFKLTPIQCQVMGSGYTDGCRANDGSHYQTPAKVKMDNGDWLFVWFWEWYNK